MLGVTYRRGMESQTIRDYAEFLPAPWRERVDLDPESERWEWRGHDVHVLRRRSPSAPTRLMLVHGAGGHAGALWPIASLVSAEVADLAAVDLPLYGDTRSPDPAAVRYGDWVDLLVDAVAAQDDGRPLVLLGASIGGMLAHEVAARSGRVAAVVATCLLDPGDLRAQRAMTRFGPLGALAGPAARLVPGRLAGVRVPMGWVAALSKMSRNPDLSALCARDPRGGGVTVPLGFFASFLGHAHVPPEHMRTPVTLAQPAADVWTPLEISAPWFSRIAAPTDLVMLRECGHFPLEEPGLSEFVRTVENVATRAALAS